MSTGSTGRRADALRVGEAVAGAAVVGRNCVGKSVEVNEMFGYSVRSASGRVAARTNGRAAAVASRLAATAVAAIAP